MQYELRLATTALGVGYFACYPPPGASFDENLGYLRSTPLDGFMHRYLLDQIGTLDAGTVERILELAWGRDPIVMGLIFEAALSFAELSGLAGYFDRHRIELILPHTPLIQAKASLAPDMELQRKWTEIFEANLTGHRPLPALEATGLPALYPPDAPSPAHGMHIREVHPGRTPTGRDIPKEAMPPAAETARMAMERLGALDLVLGEEVPHTSSLSPFGFYRRWRLDLRVRNGRHDYSVAGVQTSYGKGLSRDIARASYAMEMVERVSSFSSFGPEGALGYTREYPLTHGTYTQLQASGQNALDPNLLRLEASYAGEPLYWMEASERIPGGFRRTLLPAQAVFLFCNLDEVDLFGGLGSTGLASGNTMEQARLSALLEVIERDCEATTPYDPSGCFQVEPGDDGLGSLLAGYRSRGVHLQFQDLTAPMGVPCYKCFIVDENGRIYKGTGAHPNGGKALVSALTETTYAPIPGSCPSVPVEGPAVIDSGDLPDYSTGSISADLEILENLVLGNGFRILYVDLTRKDVGLPVVRAIVPGMEPSADFDRFSRLSPRLFNHYPPISRRANRR